MGKLENNQKLFGPKGLWGGEFLGSWCLAHYAHFHQDLGVFCGTQGMQIAKCVFSFAVLCCLSWWSFSLQCSQKTRWVCSTRGEVYLSHKQYWPIKSSSLILQHAPVWVAAGYSLIKLSLGQSVLNRKASLMDLLTKVIRRTYIETHSLLLWLIICML